MRWNLIVIAECKTQFHNPTECEISPIIAECKTQFHKPAEWEMQYASLAQCKTIS